MRLLMCTLAVLAASQTNARLLRQAATTQPLSVYVGLRWNLQNSQVTCPAWNGTAFQSDASAHAASIARVPPDQSKTDAYLAKLCADGTGAAANINRDLLAGGPTAQLAFLATTRSCTPTSPALADLWFDVVTPTPNTDYETVLKSLRAWVAAGDAQGIPACAAAVAVDKYGGVVELNQLYAGSPNMAAAGGNFTGSGGGITLPPVGPSPAIPGSNSSLPPANPSNTIYTAVRMSLVAEGCPVWNGSAWETNTEYWAASAKLAAIDWDKAMDLTSKLCASPALAGQTLLAAFETPGTPEAANAVAASLQDCPGSKLWVGRLYLNAANPTGDHSDGSKTASYAEKWVAAADAAGYALCVAIGQFDPSNRLVGQLKLVHSPKPWTGSGKPGPTGVYGYWIRPDPDAKGQPTACRAYNGSMFVADNSAWKGTVANPTPVDNAEWVAYVNAICANNATAGSTLAAAILAGGPTSKLAALSTLYRCDGSTLDLDLATWATANPYSNMDAQRAISFATAWSAALDSIGYPFCLTVSVWDNGVVANQSQVHPGGITNVGGGGGNPGGIMPPVIAPPSITFNGAT